MRDDLDRRIGEVFRRLALWRIGLGEASLDRVVTDVLQALGAAAMREAENGAALLDASRTTRARGENPGAMGPRRIDGGIRDDHDG